MKDVFLKIWKDPVVSTVVATAIIGGAVWLWRAISANTFNKALNWLASRYQVPLWLLLIFGIVTVFWFLRLFKRKERKGPPITNQHDIIAILDDWWPKAVGQSPDDVAVDFRALERQYNLQQGTARSAIEKVAAKNCYKPKFIGENHATYEYDFHKAING